MFPPPQIPDNWTASNRRGTRLQGSVDVDMGSFLPVRRQTRGQPLALPQPPQMPRSRSVSVEIPARSIAQIVAQGNAPGPSQQSQDNRLSEHVRSLPPWPEQNNPPPPPGHSRNASSSSNHSQQASSLPTHMRHFSNTSQPRNTPSGHVRNTSTSPTDSNNNPSGNPPGSPQYGNTLYDASPPQQHASPILGPGSPHSLDYTREPVRNRSSSPMQLNNNTPRNNSLLNNSPLNTSPQRFVTPQQGNTPILCSGSSSHQVHGHVRNPSDSQNRPNTNSRASTPSQQLPPRNHSPSEFLPRRPTFVDMSLQRRAQQPEPSSDSE